MPTLHIAIVGGGAAGLFAAITAKHYYPDTDVCIFEKNNKLLAKVRLPVAEDAILPIRLQILPT